MSGEDVALLAGVGVPEDRRPVIRPGEEGLAVRRHRGRANPLRVAAQGAEGPAGRRAPQGGGRVRRSRDEELLAVGADRHRGNLRPLPDEGAHLLARVGVPANGRSIARARDDHLAVGAQGDCGHLAGVPGLQDELGAQRFAGSASRALGRHIPDCLALITRTLASRRQRHHAQQQRHHAQPRPSGVTLH
jgi:hypothetical protein